jgi:hypothetical protein
MALSMSSTSAPEKTGVETNVGSPRLAEPLAGGPTEVGLEDLADVHPARHAQRGQDHVHRAAVLHERHVLFGHDLGDDALVAVAPGELVALRDLALLGHEDPDHLVDPWLQLVAVVAAEALDVDDDAALAVGHLEGRVLHLAGLLAEDGAQQLLLGRRLGLALGRDLADEHVAGANLGPDADDAVHVQVHKHVVEAFGMSRVISSGPSLVSLAWTSYSSMWMEERTSSLTIRSEMMIASSKLNPPTA